MKIAVAAALAAAWLASAAHAQADPSMRAQSPQGLAVTLEAMGYKPDPFDTSGAPSTTITIGSDTYWLILGGCNDRKAACRTVMIGSAFSDVVNPPLDWVNKMNESYDLLKVWITDEGRLGYAVQAPAAGMTQSNFRALVQGLDDASSSLAQDATEAKLVKE